MSQKKLKFAFWGTDEFSVKVLESLKDVGLQPEFIVTVPDRPQGRKLLLTPPPVKIYAGENNLPTKQPASLKHLSPEEEETILHQEMDFFLVASYGKIIPTEIINKPRWGTLNIHPSLLPKYRGASPLETAILNGDQETGVSIIKLDEEMDHGPLLAQEKFNLADKYDFPVLRDILATKGAQLLAKILPAYLAGDLEPKEQNHAEASYTQKFEKENGELDPGAPALNRLRKIMALNPWPGTYFDYPGPKGKIRLIVKKAHLEEIKGELKLVYDRVVPASRKEMSWDDFLKGLGTQK